MNVKVTKTRVVEKVVREVTDIPTEVQITLDADVFVALVSLWSHSFNGHDGGGGLRNRVDNTMARAWSQVFPGVSRPIYDAKATSDATTRARAWIRKVLA